MADRLEATWEEFKRLQRGRKEHVWEQLKGLVEDPKAYFEGIVKDVEATVKEVAAEDERALADMQRRMRAGESPMSIATNPGEDAVKSFDRRMNLLLNFAGPKAVNFNETKAREAANELRAGTDPKKVWRETGYGKEPLSRQMQFELDASQSQFTRLAPRTRQGFHDARLKEVLDYPELYANYPEIGNYPAKVEVSSLMPYPSGLFNTQAKTFQAGGRTTKEARQLLGHEIGHAIQDLEGWPSGGLSGINWLAGKILSERDILRSVAATLAQNRKPIPQELKQLLMKNMTDEAYMGRLSPQAIYDKGYWRLGGEAHARLGERRTFLNRVPRQENYPFEDPSPAMIDRDFDWGLQPSQGRATPEHFKFDVPVKEQIHFGPGGDYYAPKELNDALLRILRDAGLGPP